MPYTRKSWHDKLHDSKDLPKVIAITGRMSTRFGTGTCAIPSPLEIDGLMKKIRRGRLTTTDHLRKLIAARHKASIACPITTGIFSWIAAHAAVESAAQGAKRITPYWRTLKSNGELNPKFPGGIPALKKHLQAEGHKIIVKGKRAFVQDYEKRLARLAG